MSKMRNVVVAFLALSVLIITPAFPQGNGNAGCKNGKFIGSYIHLNTFLDIWGDGTNVEHQLIQQLNLHSDGSVTEENAGGPDIMLSAGLSTPSIGSWTCRNDGMLVVTQIFAVYAPTTDAINHLSTVPAPPPVGSFPISTYQGHVPVFCDRRKYLDENPGQEQTIRSDAGPDRPDQRRPPTSQHQRSCVQKTSGI